MRRVGRVGTLLVALLLAAGAASASAAVSDKVVSTHWLAEHLDDPNVTIIEVSVNPGVYERGHIPGAVNYVWHTDLVEPYVRDIVSPERFEALARAAGINNDTTVVFYGDNSNWFAAWGAWVFNYYGVKDVRILDGGRAKWEAERRQMTPRAVNHAPGNFTIQKTQPHLRAYLADVLEVVTTDAEVDILDIRSQAE